jgi:hypothetical protein
VARHEAPSGLVPPETITVGAHPLTQGSLVPVEACLIQVEKQEDNIVSCDAVGRVIVAISDAPEQLWMDEESSLASLSSELDASKRIEKRLMCCSLWNFLKDRARTCYRCSDRLLDRLLFCECFCSDNPIWAFLAWMFLALIIGFSGLILFSN